MTTPAILGREWLRLQKRAERTMDPADENAAEATYALYTAACDEIDQCFHVGCSTTSTDNVYCLGHRIEDTP